MSHAMTKGCSTVADEVLCSNWSVGSRIPDIVILQSSHHDVHHDTDTYRTCVDNLLVRFKRVVPASKLIWRGTLLLPQSVPKLRSLESVVINLTTVHDIQYFDTTYWYHNFTTLTHKAFTINDFSSDSVHIGSISKWRDPMRRLTLSGFLTQALIRPLCS